MSNAERIRKIRAIYEDLRAPQTIRDVAERKLRELGAWDDVSHDHVEYSIITEEDEFRDLTSWEETKNGNLMRKTSLGIMYIIFKFKKSYSNRFGLMRFEPHDYEPIFCPHKFKTQQDAADAAWENYAQ